MSQDAKDFWKGVLTVVVLFILLVIGVWAYRYYTADTRGAITAHETTTAGQYRINSYEHFYDMCASIQGYEGSIFIQEELIKDSDNKEITDRAQLILSSIKAQRIRTISQYNMDAAKERTMAKYMDQGLPKEISAKQFNTQCK